jgi:hypothetical protein
MLKNMGFLGIETNQLTNANKGACRLMKIDKPIMEEHEKELYFLFLELHSKFWNPIEISEYCETPRHMLLEIKKNLDDSQKHCYWEFFKIFITTNKNGDECKISDFFDEFLEIYKNNKDKWSILDILEDGVKKLYPNFKNDGILTYRVDIMTDHDVLNIITFSLTIDKNHLQKDISDMESRIRFLFNRDETRRYEDVEDFVKILNRLENVSNVKTTSEAFVGSDYIEEDQNGNFVDYDKSIAEIDKSEDFISHTFSCLEYRKDISDMFDCNYSNLVKNSHDVNYYYSLFFMNYKQWDDEEALRRDEYILLAKIVSDNLGKRNGWILNTHIYKVYDEYAANKQFKNGMFIKFDELKDVFEKKKLSKMPFLKLYNNGEDINWSNLFYVCEERNIYELDNFDDLR